MYKILLLSAIYSRLAGCPSISLLSALSEPSWWQYLRGTQWTLKIIPVMEQPLVLSHLILSTMPLPSY